MAAQSLPSLGTEIAPDLREAPDADVPADHLCCDADTFSEGREGKLKLGDVLHGKASGHAGGDGLDGLG
jgi:hypothetical protein